METSRCPECRQTVDNIVHFCPGPATERIPPAEMARLYREARDAVATEPVAGVPADPLPAGA